jgi:hypothetical protein
MSVRRFLSSVALVMVAAAAGTIIVAIVSDAEQDQYAEPPVVVLSPAGDTPSPVAGPDDPSMGADPGPVEVVSVVELVEAAGILSSDGEDWYLDGVEVDAGPRWYVSSNPAPADLDGDVTIETLASELDGLVGRSVTLLGERDDDTDLDLFVIEGVKVRPIDGQRPPWEDRRAGAPTRPDAAPTVGRDEAATIVLAATPGTVVEVGLIEDGTRSVWEVYVRRPDGRVIESYVDTASGRIVEQELQPLGEE